MMNPDNAPQYWLQVSSPVGTLLLTATARGLSGLFLEAHAASSLPPLRGAPDPGPFNEVRRQLEDYFEGRLRSFDLPLDLIGTAFQRKVWQELQEIPYGTTLSYGELAARLGSPRASRAVGLANGRNPVSIVVPCHRVIGADGSLTGYGGGLHNKRALLEWEAEVSGSNRYAPPLPMASTGQPSMASLH